MKCSTMLPEESQTRCEDKIEKHSCEVKIEEHKYENKIKAHKVTYLAVTMVLRDPSMPWYDFCTQSESKNDVRRRARPKVLPVLQPDYAITDTQQGQPHFDLMIGTDKSTGAIWASAVFVRGKEDPYIISSILSWLSELGYSKFIIQSDAEVVLRMVQSKSATMENPPCEIVQRQSQQYSHQIKEDAEWRIQTIRNQIKAYKIQIEKNSGIIIKDVIPLLTWLSRHEAWQYMRFHRQQDSTTAYEKIRHILLVGEAVADRRPGTWCSRRKSVWLEGIWFGSDSKTNEHLIGTPNGMVRCSTLMRGVNRQRWGINLLNAMRIPQMIPIPVTKGKLLKVYSDREPIPMRTISRVPTQEMMGNCTETETEEIPRPLHKTRTTKSAVITRTETTSQTRTTSSARTFDERFATKLAKIAYTDTSSCSRRVRETHCWSTTNTPGEDHESQR